MYRFSVKLRPNPDFQRQPRQKKKKDDKSRSIRTKLGLSVTKVGLNPGRPTRAVLNDTTILTVLVWQAEAAH